MDESKTTKSMSSSDLPKCTGDGICLSDLLEPVGGGAVGEEAQGTEAMGTCVSDLPKTVHDF